MNSIYIKGGRKGKIMQFQTMCAVTFTHKHTCAKELHWQNDESIII